MVKCISDEILNKLPPNKLVLIRHKDGSYNCAIIESINKNGTVTVIESNNRQKNKFLSNKTKF